MGIRLIQEKKRLAMVCRILWTGGVALVAIEQQKALLLEGYNSDLFFLRDANSLYETPGRTQILNKQNQYNGLTRRILSTLTKKFAGHRGGEATVDLDYIFDSRKILKNYDEILFHDQWSALMGFYYRIKGIKYVVQLHEFFRPPPGMKKYSIFAVMAWIYDIFTIILAPAVVTTSEYNYNIVKKFKRDTFLVRIGFPKPVLVERSNNKKFFDQRKVVLSLTLWDKGRHPDFYADLAIALPELDFVVAGTWTIKDEMKSFIEKTRVIKNLKVTGSVDEKEKLELISSAHFYIRLGYNERGPGMGALESMSYGLIPFANKGIGLSELIQDKVNGFLVAEPLLENTITAFKFANNLSPNQLEIMAKRNIDLCNTFSWENNVKDLLKIFAKL